MTAGLRGLGLVELADPPKGSRNAPGSTAGLTRARRAIVSHSPRAPLARHHTIEKIAGRRGFPQGNAFIGERQFGGDLRHRPPDDCVEK